MSTPGWVGLRGIQRRIRFSSFLKVSLGAESMDTQTHTHTQTDTQIQHLVAGHTASCRGTLGTGSLGRLPRENLTGEARGKSLHLLYICGQVTF